MNRITLSLWSLSVLALGNLNVALAQEMPKTQPKLITIWREQVKVGHAVGHAKHEAGFVAAFEKAKSPYHYLAMTSLTGPTEAWYVTPFDSHAAIADSMKREDKDPGLSAALTRLALEDAKYIDGLRIIQAQARVDLSVGTFPDLANARFFEIAILRVRPGHESGFEEAAKVYGAARMRAAPKHGFRVYQVIAGMPAPTFLLFSSVDGYAEFDEMIAAHEATFKALKPEEGAVLKKFQTEGEISWEANRFKLDPTQSYVSKETRAQDPAFWSPK